MTQEQRLPMNDKMRDFDKSIWNADLATLSSEDRQFAIEIFDCLMELGSRPFHRKSARARGKSDHDHIFKTKGEDLFWSDVHISRSCLTLHFPDKLDKFHGTANFPAQWSRSKQGEGGKNEKDIILSGKYRHAGEFFPLLEEIHENANIWYGRIKDSTKLCETLFGVPKGGTPLRVPNQEEFSKLLHSEKCAVCGSQSLLALAVDKTGKWTVLCDKCHHSPSRWTKIAETIIPLEVKSHVWHRDGGVCVECGSRKLIQFDHMIPRSRGGSNTENNIRLKCQSCNYTKGNKLIP